MTALTTRQISLKEGYQPSKKGAETKIVKKPKPNLLDKPTAKQTERTSSAEPSPPPDSPSPAQNSAQTQRVDELFSELQKMKAIILKHEVRIRELEKKGQNLDNVTTTGVGSESNNNGDSNLLPDEV